MTVKSLRRCLLTFTVAGIVACGPEETPPAGPDVTVSAAIVVSPDSLRLGIDDTARVRAAVLNVAGDTLPLAPVSFLSSDTTVATIDASGLVRARAGGVSDVEVRSDTITTILRVRVAVNGTLTVSPRVTFLQEGDSVQLSVVVKDSAGTVLLYEPVQYRSLDTSVARVSPSGRVSFGGVAGSVMIQVSSVGRTDGAFITAVVRRQPSGEGRLATARGNTAFTVVDGRLQRVDLETGTVTDEPFVGNSSLADLVVDSGRTRAYLANDQGGMILAVDLVADTVRSYVVAGTYQGPRALALAPGDSILYFVADSQLYRVRLATFAVTPVLAWGYAHHLASRGDMLYAACWTRLVGTRLCEFNMRTSSPGRILGSGVGGSDFALSADGQRLYLNVYRRLEIWDLVRGEPVDTVSFGSAYGAAAFVVQPATGFVWLSVPFDGRVYVIDPVLARVVRAVQLGGAPGAIAFGASGNGLIVNPNTPPATTHWFDFVR